MPTTRSVSSLGQIKAWRYDGATILQVMGRSSAGTLLGEQPWRWAAIRIVDDHQATLYRTAQRAALLLGNASPRAHEVAG